MKEGLEYLEELLGKAYFHDKDGLNVHTDNIYCAPESQLKIVEIPPGKKRDYLNDLLKSKNKTMDDYIVIHAFCPYHGDFEVFRPNEIGARYNNVFCPKCIDYEVQLTDNEHAERDTAERKRKAEQAREEAKQNRRNKNG